MKNTDEVPFWKVALWLAFIVLPLWGVYEYRRYHPSSPVALPSDTLTSTIQYAQDTLSEIEQDIPKTQWIFSKDSLLYNVSALIAFFKNLHQLQQGDTLKVHIAFYGDSQIEGDRVTFYLRHFFQKNFGGNGIGFVPWLSLANHLYVKKRVFSDNWERYSIFPFRGKYPYMGISGNLYRFSDSSAWLRWELRSYAHYDSVFLLWGRAKKPLTISIVLKDSLIYHDTLPAIGYFEQRYLPIPPNTTTFFIRFQSKESPDFYGFAFDGKQGVQIDNYAIRGHTGQGWFYVAPSYLALQLRRRHTKLIILEYGGNALPYLKKESLPWFERKFAQVVQWFRKTVPEIPILIVGVGLMGYYDEGQIPQCYEVLPLVVALQRRIAKRFHCAFWDAYKAMGGNKALAYWIEKKMIAQDLAHLSPAGQKLLAKKLYQSIKKAYENYLLAAQ